MSKDLNKVMLTGHLGATPEMRFTNAGTPTTTFRVAANRTWKDEQGHTHEDTEWFRIVAWDRLAEVCNTYLSKGTRVYVEGRLQTRKWQDRAGQERYTTEVIAHDMIILSTRESVPTSTPAEPDPPTPPAPPTTPARRSRRRGIVTEDLPL